MLSRFPAAVSALALLAVLTACDVPTPGDSTPSVGAPVPAPASTTEPAPESSEDTEPAPEASEDTEPATQTSRESGKTAKAACAAGDLEVIIAAQETGEKDEKAMVVVTNIGAKSCTVKGWLTIALHNAADEAVAVPTKKVDEPGPPEAVEIKPDRSAFAGIKWTQCDKAAESCAVGNTLRWSLTGAGKGAVAELESFPSPEKSNITMKALKIGTLQPSNQGVVAW